MKTRSCIILALGVALASFAQGTVNFANLGAGVNAPFYLPDGITKVSGPEYTAELMAGPTAGSLASVATTGFLTGQAAGYFAGGAVSIPPVAGGGTAFLQVRVWTTSAGSFAAALSNPGYVWGQSGIFSVVTGDNSASPPTVPAALTGLGATITPLVPEPSSLAFMGVGAAVLLAFRRRSG